MLRERQTTEDLNYVTRALLEGYVKFVGTGRGRDLAVTGMGSGWGR